MRAYAIMAAAALTVLAGCKSKTDESTTTRTAVAGPATLKDVARLTGTVQPIDTMQVKSEVSYQITKIHVKEGDYVKKGQLLFELDRVQLDLKHQQLMVAVETAKLSLRSAQRDLERAREQLKNGSVSADHVQDLEIERDKASLALKTAELDLKSNERDLSNTRIVAPRNGQMIRLDVTEGEMAVAASSASGNVLGVIADPTRLKVVVEVSELDFPRLKLGQKVEITTESQPNKIIPGSVSYIPPSAQASSSNSSVMVFKVEVTLDAQSSQSALVPGMTVNVDFVFLEKKVAIAVPYDMVTMNADSTAKAVYVRSRGPAAGGKPPAGAGRRPHPGKGSAVSGTELRTITVGSTDYKTYEILSGLKAGDTIFAAPDSSSKSSSKGGAGGPP